MGKPYPLTPHIGQLAALDREAAWLSATGGFLPHSPVVLQGREYKALPSPPLTHDDSSTLGQFTLDNIRYPDLPSRFSSQILCTTLCQAVLRSLVNHSACLPGIKQPQPHHQVALYHRRIASFSHQPANNQTIKIEPFIWSAVP